MNYIVMDLEWNQSAKGKQFSEDHFPFEIIQIGAAKVNEKLDIVDEWQCTIKPQVYTKLQNTVRKILGITEMTLLTERISYRVLLNFLNGAVRIIHLLHGEAWILLN